MLEVIDQHLRVGAATIYQSIFQRTFGRIELTGHDAIENRERRFHASGAAETTDGSHTGFAQWRVQSLRQSRDCFDGASAAEGEQSSSMLPSVGGSGFVNSHVQQAADAKTLEQRGELVSGRHLDAVEQNRFNDVAIEGIETPRFGGDFAGDNFVPLGAQGHGAIVSSAEVARAVPASQHNESDQEKNSQQGD